MRAALFAMVASISLFGVGCHHNTCSNGCSTCCESCGDMGYGYEGTGAGRHFAHGLYEEDYLSGGRFGHDHFAHGHRHGPHMNNRGPARVGHLPHHYMQQQMYGQGGPQGPTVAYPYYTTRAPRDFLLDNPASIGP